MRDVRGYRAYQRLKRGWRLLSFALLGISFAPMLRGVRFAPDFSVGYSLMSWSLALALAGALLAASGSFGGKLRATCLFVACNAGLLLGYQGRGQDWGGFSWLIFSLALLAGDRLLRREMGLAKGINLFPPGCVLPLLALPFFWPMAILQGGTALLVYLVFAYAYVARALPRPRDLLAQLEEPGHEAMAALTRI